MQNNSQQVGGIKRNYDRFLRISYFETSSDRILLQIRMQLKAKHVNDTYLRKQTLNLIK